MRTSVIGVLTAAALMAASGTWLTAQGRERFGPPSDLMMLMGGGSQIGVRVRDLSAEEITKARLDQPGGVFIEDVREGTPAVRAGLRAGDIVVEFDGERVRSASHFTRLVRETAPGRAVRSSVVRNGARVTLDITPDAGERRSMALPPDFPNLPDFNLNMPRDLDPLPELRVSPRGQIGVTLAPLTEQLASYFGVKQGVLVSSVLTDSAAAQAGLRAGDVITAVNDRNVQNVGDVTRAVRDARPGSMLNMRVVRDGKETTVMVTIPERIDQPRSVLPV